MGSPTKIRLLVRHVAFITAEYAGTFTQPMWIAVGPDSQECQVAMLTEFTRRKDLVECLTYLVVDVGKEITELAFELALNDGDVVRMCLCFEAKGVFDLKNLSVVVTYAEIDGVKGEKKGNTHVSHCVIEGQFVVGNFAELFYEPRASQHDHPAIHHWYSKEFIFVLASR